MNAASNPPKRGARDDTSNYVYGLNGRRRNGGSMKTKTKPTNAKPRMKLVNKLIAEIESAVEGCEEYATSSDSCLAEWVSDFGYGENEMSFEYIDDEVKETLEALVATNPKNWRSLVLPFCSVELHGVHYVENALFSATIGEQEHQLDELDDQVSKLTDAEQNLIREKTYMKPGGRIYTSHDYDRFVLVLDVDAFLEKYPVKSIKVYGPLKLVWSA